MRTTCLAAFLSAAAALCVATATASTLTAEVPAPIRVAMTTAAPSLEPCGRAEAMTALQRRILAEAAQGVDSLRRFISITRGIYQLDMESTVAWLDQERALPQSCQAAAAIPAVAQRRGGLGHDL
jgi:hypothetical protein